MRLRIKYFFLLISLLLGKVNSQVVSSFNWNTSAPMQSAVGPTATSIGATALTSTGGVGGTNGLNPGPPTASDINMVIPNTSNIFDLPNVDISIDYRRNESTAQMIKRSTFTTNTGGGSANFRVTYRVNNAGTPVTITSTVVNVPQDNTFRNYRFTYDNCTGVGQMYVNNVVVWTSPSPTVNLNLYWTGDGNVVVGQDMDGAGNNIPNLDNFSWGSFTCSTLPIELSSFKGIKEESANHLTWSTMKETNNDFFTLEKSQNGYDWKDVTRVYGSGNSSHPRNYSAYDTDPEPAINYYRLKQTDYDGQMKRYSVITIDNSKGSQTIIKQTDLLGREIPYDYEGVKLIFYSDGTVLKN